MILTKRQQSLFRGNGSGVGTLSARETADAVITALSPAAWYRNATDVVSSGGFASIWADYASTAQGLALPGVAGNSATTPDSVPLSITGDIDIAVRVAPADWTPAIQSYLVGKLTGNAGYAFRLQATGELAFVWGNGAGYAVTGSTAATGFTDGAAKWVRVTVDVSNGSSLYEVKFYTAADSATVPGSWTQLGTTITGGAAMTIADNAAVLSVGLDTSLTQPLTGTIFRAIVKDGIDGTTVFDADFSAQAIGTASFTESSSNAATVTINTSGAAPAHIGKARDLLQGTGTNQPAYAAGVFTFDGADNFLKCLSVVLAQPITVAIRFNPVSWSSGDRVFDLNFATLYQTPSTPQLNVYAGSAGPQSAAGTPALGAFSTAIAIFNGASSHLYLDGVDATGNAGALGGASISLGSNSAAGAFSNIQVKEFVIFNSAISGGDLTDLQNAMDSI